MRNTGISPPGGGAEGHSRSLEIAPDDGALLRRLVDHLPGMAYRCANDGGRTLEFVSQGALELTGYAPAALLAGQVRFLELIHAEDRDRVREETQAALRQGRRWELRYRLQTAKGEEKWIWEQGGGVAGAAGEITGLEGFCTNITAFQKTQEALRRSEASLARAQQIGRMGDWEWNIQTNELRWSDEIYRIFGLEPRQFGATYDAFLAAVHPADRELVDRAVGIALRDRMPYSIDHRIVRPCGTERIVHEQGEITCDARGVPLWMRGTVQDITERKQAELALRESEARFRQVQKMDAIGRLAGGIAHDFNNLLSVINGYSDLSLLAQGLDDELRTNLSEIRTAGERAARLTRQLLAFSRKQVVTPQVVDLGEIVRGMESMLRCLIREDIELEIETDPQVGAVLADASQLEQVLLNLAVNARDAMPNGGRLLITTRRVEVVSGEPAGERSGHHVLLTVHDTGCGMDAETASRIFEPFFTTKGIGEGTGLGLATVYGIVTQWGGRIEVASQPRCGATFGIYLPGTDSGPHSVPVSPSPNHGPAGSETVLLVEDEVALRQLIRDLLTGRGYAVLEAQTTEEALGVSEETLRGVDLLLTDVVMPGHSGRRIAETLTARHPGLRVLFMTGYTGDAMVRYGLEAGELALLQKPFTPAGLFRAVRSVLDARAR